MLRKFSHWSTLLGNLFEHYDTTLFAFLTPFFAPLFFPYYSPIVALLMTYGMLPLGLLTRPLGALVFGYMGDKYGRQYALYCSLLGMSLTCALLAALPTYKEIGILAPILLIISRLIQNFFAAGETSGGAIFLLESVPDHQRDWMSSLYGASTVAGMVLASFGVSILSHFNFLEQGWRLLYLIGCITAFFAFFLRRQASLPTVKTTPFSWRTTWNYLVEWRQTLFLIASAAGFYYATATMAFIFINGFAPLVCRVTATEMARMNTYLLMIDCLSLPLFGFVASFVPRVRLMRWASTCAIIFGMPLFMLLDNGSLWNVVIVRAFLMIIGVWFSATFYSWSQNLAPKTHRYTLISLGYTLGSQLLGAPAAAISLWLFQSTQWTFSASWYWILLALIVNFWTLVPKQQLKIAPQN